MKRRIALALRYAPRLDSDEVAGLMAPVHNARSAFGAGVADARDWRTLAGAMSVGHAIERLGAVRGVHGHLAAGQEALQALLARGAGAQRFPIPHLAELDALDTAISLHGYQLLQLSRGDYARACQLAEDSLPLPA